MVATYAVLLAAAGATLGPLALSFMTSFKTPRQFATQSALTAPDPWTGENYRALLGGQTVGFGHALLVTTGVVVVVLIGQLTTSVMAAFAFARLDFPGRDLLFWAYVATLMVPPVVTVVPLYLMVSQVGLRNTFWGLVLPYIFGSPYAIFLLRQYFRGIPQELVDAARVDGAGPGTVLLRIILPLSRPIMATLGVITVVTHWNNFLWPLIITNGSAWQVVTTATANLQGRYNGNWTLVMAATTLAMAPLMAVFVVFNKQIVSSIQITGFR